MTQTIIGVFNSFERANAAKAALASRSLALENDMHVNVDESLSDAGATAQYNDAGAIVPNTGRDNAMTKPEHHGMVASIEHFFSDLFGNDERPPQAEHYQEAVRRGSALLAVDVEDETRIRAVEAELERAGAVDIDSRVAQWQTQGYTGYNPEAAAYTADDMSRERETFPVIQEDLEVGKREVETGRLRVYSRPTVQNVSESVSLHEEHAEIERRMVNREATAADMTARTVEIRETEEVPVVAKTARVVEEVVVGKQGSDRTETIKETLHGNTVEVEEVSGAKTALTPNSTTTKTDTLDPNKA